ncbi:hypothetical protein N7456_008807 [Penicillium angulare]|uniref:Zn(2)-C6 fungal-type domain-containing protein n=1 Tax=Penicillium angulare TaxID=116970 RepID=A0A9W9F3J5_9EURO|nr:hypothetical protein N7456_008807 [Penicillium angulare]
MSDSVTDPDPLAAESAGTGKKRTRVQFSCTACRFRKLKCCRTYPCTNCKKRGEAGSCTFVGRGPRAKAQHGRASPTLVQDRLQHLENLVMSLAQQQKPENESFDFNNGPHETLVGYDTPPSTNDRVTKSSPRDTGTLVVDDEGTSYIDSANWRAILEEINGVREYLDEQEENSDGDGIVQEPFENCSPVLLLGISKPVTKQEILGDIPSRMVADRLVSRFLKSSEPSLIVIHVPTFLKEYERFWINPHEMSFTWIALLYAIMALAVSSHNRSEEPLPMKAVDTMSLWDVFRRRTAQCLVQSNYLTPGKYKVNALFVYAITELYRSQDGQIGVSHILSIAIRLAMRMGYHRDPSHYPNLSPFDGEMRRRMWALLCQLDILVSFQNGLPRTIQPYYQDAQLPSNLLDTDFDENTVQLPPCRPAEDRTPCSYTRAKGGLMDVFGQICDSAYRRDPVSYEEIMAMNSRLEAAHSQIPAFLRVRTMAESMGEQTNIILARYTLDLIYQKSRIVLHRRYITERQGTYANSRSICISAASASLRHHKDIWSESLPGGQLYKERFLLNSLQNTDFMLSAMILCLAPLQTKKDSNTTQAEIHEQRQLLCLLESTHKIFKRTRRSPDTQRAFIALSIMLSRVKGCSVESLTSASEELEDDPYHLLPNPATGEPQQPMLSPDGMQAAILTNTSQTPSYASLDVINEMLSMPSELDWNMYDSKMYGFSTAQDNAWTSEPTPDMDFSMPLNFQMDGYQPQ